MLSSIAAAQDVPTVVAPADAAPAEATPANAASADGAPAPVAQAVAPPIPETRATVVGVLPPLGEGPRLIVRHVVASGAAAVASATTYSAGEPPVVLEARGDVVALAATGEAATVLLVLDDVALRGEATAEAALIDAVRATLNPGEQVGVALLGIPAPAGQLAPTGNLDVIDTFVRSQAAVQRAAGDRVAELTRVLSELGADTATHREAVVVVAAGASDTSLPTLVSSLRTAGIPLSAVVVAPSGISIDESATLDVNDPFCVAARQSGGVCRVTTSDGEQFAETVRRVVAEAQSLYVAPVRCTDALVGLDRVNVVARTVLGQSEPMMLATSLLACSSYTPPAPPVVVEASGAAPAAGSGDPVVGLCGPGSEESNAECATAAGVLEPSVPRWVIPAAVAGGVLLLVVVAISLARRRRSAFALDDDDLPISPSPAGPMRITALDTLAPNTHAAALQAKGPVPDQTRWLRDPEVSQQRVLVREHFSTLTGLHLTSASGATVDEVRLSGPVLVGNSPECQVICPSLAPGRVALRLTPTGDGARLQQVDPSIAVECNGESCAADMTLRPGDELVVAGVVVELRLLVVGDGPAAFKRETRRAMRRLVARDARAFDPIEVGSQSVVVGRDPLPYRGVRAIPTRLVISQVSNDHAEFWISGGVLYVRDLGSSNGTMIAGARLQPFVVTPVSADQTVSVSALVPFMVQ